jgi:hypothetical protein
MRALSERAAVVAETLGALATMPVLPITTHRPGMADYVRN